MSLLSKYAFGILLITSTLISCKKENSQPKKNNPGYGNISYFAKASVTGTKSVTGVKTFAVADSAVSTVVVDWASASVYVEKIEFVGQSDNLLDTSITVQKNLNIFSANALAGVIQLPAGSYKNVKVKMFCKKSDKSELAFSLKGTFTNTNGGKDSVLVGSSYPFEANLAINDIVVNSSDKYKAVFTFDLNKVLTGISTRMLETARTYTSTDNKKTYVIWKGGSAEELFYDQVISNWQNVASAEVSKE